MTRAGQRLRRRPSKLAIALASVLPSGGGALAGPPLIRATLEAETPRPAAGSRVTFALRMVPAAGWHGYWQNPGDAGAATFVSWNLPEGAAMGPLRYPLPGRMMTGNLMNYVYERPYALLMTFSVPPGLKPGTPLRIAGRARWLACSASLCVPEQGPVSIDLVVGDGRVAEASRRRFASWRSGLPIPLGQPGRFESKGGKVILSIPYSRRLPLADPYFYPAIDRVIDYAAPQLITRRGDRLIVEAKAAANGKAVTSLEGVIAIGGRGYGVTARPR